MRIFIDDVRKPKTEDFDYVVRNHDDFLILLDRITHIRLGENYYISYISFDHDLGTEKSGYDCCKLLIDYDMVYGILDEDFTFSVHSANLVGKENIESLLNNWLEFKRQLHGE
jgi:hypothetical protein